MNRFGPKSGYGKRMPSPERVRQMSFETFIGLFTFAFVATATPGPNNLMVMASGVNFGFRRTVPHVLGITGGFTLLVALIGLGLGSLLTAYPAAHFALKIAGGAYLLYLAWRIGTSRQVGKGSAASEPLSALGAAAFQWVNPKGWMMAVTATSLYAVPGRPFTSAAIVALVFGAVCLPIVSVWAGFGTKLRDFLSDPKRLKLFNMTMGVLLALTTIPMML